MDLLKTRTGLSGLLSLVFGAKLRSHTARHWPAPKAEKDLIEEEGPLSREEILRLREIQIASSALYGTDGKTPHGYYAGRPIIRGSSAIGCGVYLGLVGHEAIVVDERGEYLKNAYEQLLARLMRFRAFRDKTEHAVVNEVVSLSRDLLRYDDELVSHLLEREGIESDQRVSLDLFLREGIGASRHQILLSGWLLEQLRRHGIVKGRVYIESTLDARSAPLERLVYTTVKGEIIIFDPRAYEMAIHTRLAVGEHR